MPPRHPDATAGHTAAPAGRDGEVLGEALTEPSLGEQAGKRRSARLLLLVVLTVAVTAACGSPTEATRSQETTTSGRPSTSAAAVTAEAPSGTCADPLDPESFPVLICRWVADADIGTCDLMSDKLLEERFGGSVQGCQETIGRLAPADDRSVVSFEDVVASGDRATLRLNDRAHKPALGYQVTFVKDGPTWRIDTIRQNESVSSAESPQPSSQADPVAQQKIRNIVLQWYRRADPGVCDLMTDAMLTYGWKKTGDAGRDACRSNIVASDPVQNVNVRMPRIRSERATVRVAYTLDDTRQIDELTFVNDHGQWIIDAVKLKGFVP